ncbi:hypothetical protein J6590_008888 [Homalodisca vitripennis]|nr:hypothetical protein J6590_008888 [Homalodisca vitripennis]
MGTANNWHGRQLARPNMSLSPFLKDGQRSFPLKKPITLCLAPTRDVTQLGPLDFIFPVPSFSQMWSDVPTKLNFHLRTNQYVHQFPVRKGGESGPFPSVERFNLSELIVFDNPKIPNEAKQSLVTRDSAWPDLGAPPRRSSHRSGSVHSPSSCFLSPTTTATPTQSYPNIARLEPNRRAVQLSSRLGEGAAAKKELKVTQFLVLASLLSVAFGLH